LIFEDACSSIESSSCYLAVDVLMEMGSIFKKQCKYLRSALAAARSKCIIFLFADWDVSDCFCGKVDAIDLKERECFKLVENMLRNGMASAFPLKQ
jgi:hypothetical protein